MGRLSALAFSAAWALALGLVACGGNDDGDYGVMQPPGGSIDAAVDAPGSAGDAATDARSDGGPDASATDSGVDASLNGADLSVELTDSPDAVAASATLTYTIDVTNLGGLDAANVEVVQRLPAGNVAFQSASGIGWTCNASGQLVTCTRTTLLVGDAPSIAVKVTTPPVGGTITTSVTVSSDTNDPVATNNEASASTTVLTPADLAIAISDSPDPVAAGGTLSYAIAVTNHGPGAATALTVLDSLPSNLAFVSASGTNWSCSAVSQDVTCLNPSLAASASSSITLVVTAPASGGTVSNTVSVSAMTPDSDSSNNQATTSTTVNAAADLSIAMSDSPDPVLGSGTLQYAIDVTNNGPNTASGITVTDGLPAGNVAFVSAAGSGWTCALAGQIVTCTRPTLLAGAAPTITVTVTAPSEAASLSNTATVASTSSDLNNANNGATVTTTVLAAADLSVGVQDSPDPVTTGGTLDYTVTTSNAGPSQATNVTVTSNLPPGTGFLSASGINWTCSAIGQQVTCTTPTMALGAAPAITIHTTAPSADGTITETSSVNAATADASSSNNSASQSTVVNAPSDLSLQLSASASSVAARSSLTYTIDVTNLGPRDATNLSVTNRLPDGNVQFVSANGIGWACALAGQIVTCTRPLLIVGVAPSIAIQIITPPSNGTLVDQASVSASTADLQQANNTASLSTNVFDSADLSITATETPDPVRIGTNLSYSLAVANDGPTSATGITVVDTLPSGTTFVSASGSGWSCGNSSGTVTCTMPSLAASSSAPAIAIVATAPATAGNITNSATVSSGTSDPDGSDNTATTVTLANAFADLSVTIADSPDPVTGSTNTGCGASDCVTYTITVSNAGPDPAAGVRVVSQLPGNGLFFNAVGSGWVCPAPSGTLTCTRTNLAIGATSTITLVWKAPSPGGFSIVVSSLVSGSSTDPSSGNNNATQDTTVNP